MKAKKAWQKVIENINNDNFSGWAANAEPISIDSKELKISVENKFLKEKIEAYKTEIEYILRDIFIDSENIKLKISIAKEKKEKVDPNAKLEFESSRKRSLQGPNPKYIFNNFVVGKSNEFAHAAAKGVASSPGKVYNPLFIYGGVGLGKTHLMHAIGNSILQNNPTAKVHYCSSEHFTNNLINSLKKDKMTNFREKYRKLDALLIDDIQFIQGKDSTQEEFFHTFNTLHQYSKQIVVSSDRPPENMKNIEARLISRFAWGLIADIKAPDYETRAAILKNKSEIEGIKIPEKAIEYIAESVDSNIRELEGALNRVVAKASLLNRAIDFELIQDIFKMFKEDKAKKITKSKIIKAVSNFYNIPVKEMESNKRRREIAKSRQISMYLLRNLIKMSFSSIGEIFGGKDHTTVMHSVNKIDAAIAHDSVLGSELEEIKRILS